MLCKAAKLRPLLAVDKRTFDLCAKVRIQNHVRRETPCLVPFDCALFVRVLADGATGYHCMPIFISSGAIPSSTARASFAAVHAIVLALLAASRVCRSMA